MSRDLCQSCRGSGEGYYLANPGDKDDASGIMGPCRSCGGSGFERRPIPREKQDTRANRRIMRACVAAMDRQFGRKGS